MRPDWRPQLPQSAYRRLVRDHKDIITQSLIEFHILDVVFRERGTLLHLESLAKSVRHQHAVDLFHLLDLCAEGLAVTLCLILAHTGGCRIDEEVRCIAIGIGDPKGTLLHLTTVRIRQSSDRVTWLVKLRQHR